MCKIKLTKGKYALVDKRDFFYLNKWKWHALNDNGTFYAARTVRRGTGFHKILMHRLLTGAVRGQEVDHKNSDKLDNRRRNLRLCTHGQNQQNRILQRSNTSGVKGVNWHKHCKKWCARIAVSGSRKFLGYFDNKKDAALAYKKAARKYHRGFYNGGGLSAK